MFWVYLMLLIGLGIGIGFIFVGSTNKKRRTERNIETAKRTIRIKNIDIGVTKDFNNLPGEYVALCIKATGYNAVADDIIDICALKVFNGKIKEQFSQMVHPRIAVPTSVLMELGITEIELNNKPPIENVSPELVKFIGNIPIITYNADITTKFLVANSEKELDNKCIDIVSLAKSVYSDLDNYRIRDIAKKCNIEIPSVHNALNDCKAICKCYESLKRS
ncbi:MAG: 3'-5' exonuclease [Ruminococcaceae bacterium]|nr:3'-5' exonuclease [Oscillospiraceae bacterium]